MKPVTSHFVSGWSGVQIPPPAPTFYQPEIGLERIGAYSRATGRRSEGCFEWRRAEVGSRGYMAVTSVFDLSGRVFRSADVLIKHLDRAAVS
jgi:hypothetical protein